MTIIDKHNLGWAEYVNKLEQQNAELLDVLKEVRDWCDTSDDGDPIEMDYIFQPPWYQELRIIIAKAEGVTNL